ncbi:sulfotransferase [Croceicoccus sp. F390]|uniref:Sulfotransferase n=1 Tax=Croceicoccus esteveae TaxID=3075597 RepID=A0ABU2ZKA4_9SPHN|nr:sulfotransferase [Croceicoccus sp. F390]MDT0577028.1 sulfotransferase [Croceicoccus sp. F390]
MTHDSPSPDTAKFPATIPANQVEQPFFIVGPGRSGTTLLTSTLNRHSRLCVTPETHFLHYRRRHFGTAAAPPDFESFWQDYTRWPRFKDLDIPVRRCRDRILASGDTSFANIFSIILAVFAEKQGKPRVGEKTPGHTRYLDTLDQWFGSPKVLFTIRDPRASGASQLKTGYRQPELDGRPALQRIVMLARDAAEWVDIYARRWADAAERMDMRMVRYETLVAAPQDEMQAICMFLGEPYESGLVARSRCAPSPASTSGVQEGKTSWTERHLRKSRSAVTTASVDKWRGELSRLEVGLIEAIAGPTMRAHGYRPEANAALRQLGRAILASARLLLKADDAAKRVRQRLLNG